MILLFKKFRPPIRDCCGKYSRLSEAYSGNNDLIDSNKKSSLYSSQNLMDERIFAYSIETCHPFRSKPATFKNEKHYQSLTKHIGRICGGFSYFLDVTNSTAWGK